MASDGIEMLRATVERLFAEHVDKERIIRAESGVWLEHLWRIVEDNGLTQPHVLAEDGCAWPEAFALARASGRHCVPLPLVETILASWLLAQAGLDVPAGPLTFAAGADGGRLTRVPWARHAGHLVVVGDGSGRAAELSLIATGGLRLEPGTNLALEPRDTVEIGSAAVVASGTVDLAGVSLDAYAAMLRAGQMAGALDALLDMSVRYAGERVQFGRPLAKFQAIQQELAKLAGAVAEAGVAAEAAFAAAQRAGRDGRDPTFEIAAAKVVTGEAAELAPRIAHQVHGAIGFTYEHQLHFASRRLWSWRSEYGSAAHWADELGRQAYAVGADGLWPMVTGRQQRREV